MMISRLRKKLLRLDPGLARNLRSARGQGYLWIDERIRQD
jgi:DNA-binding response OmpR family regulator